MVEVSNIIEVIKNGENESLKRFFDEGIIKNVKDINDKTYPVIVDAARSANYDDLLHLLKLGADINSVNHVGASALSHAFSWKNYEAVNALLELGINIEMHGGKALRHAAWMGNFDIVKLLIENGANVNYNGADQVFPECSTPVQMAASSNHFEIVKLLVENGADVRIKDKDGDRAYSEAKRQKNTKLMEYIKQFEPAIWHEEEKRKEELKRLGLNNEIIKWLGTENKSIELTESKSSEYIEFENIFDIRVMEWQGRIFLDLVKDIEGYANTGFLVWIKDKKSLGSLDTEHDNLCVLHGVKWKQFVQNASGIVDDILNGSIGS